MIRGLLQSMMDALVEQITGVMYNFLSPGCTYLGAYIRTGGTREAIEWEHCGLKCVLWGHIRGEKINSLMRPF